MVVVLVDLLLVSVLEAERRNNRIMKTSITKNIEVLPLAWDLERNNHTMKMNITMSIVVLALVWALEETRRTSIMKMNTMSITVAWVVLDLNWVLAETGDTMNDPLRLLYNSYHYNNLIIYYC